MAIYEKINTAKKIQIELSQLREQFTQLSTPTLSDPQNLSEIHQLICCRPNVDSREMRHYFVIISVYLYSPLSLLGPFPIKAGLCREMGKVIGRCRQEVSEIFYQAKFRYENVPSFREQVEDIFEQRACDEKIDKNRL